MLKVYPMFCTIWHHMYNLENVKNTQGGMSLLVNLQAYITTKDTPDDRCFEFFNQFFE